MYRIYDKQEAIRRVQTYLILAGDDSIFIAPTGVYDDNTRASVAGFQSANSLMPTGDVDRATFELLYEKYLLISEKRKITESADSFISFPLSEGYMDEEMIHINRILARLLEYYGLPHRLRSSRFYSKETGLAVRSIREIYRLPGGDEIDEIMYSRMVRDHDSIGRFNNNFR